MDKIEGLKKINKLFEDGVISQTEFEKLKSELLNNNSNNSKSTKSSKDEAFYINSSESEIKSNKHQTTITNQQLFPKWSIYLFVSIIVGLIIYYQLYLNGVVKFENKTEETISYDNIKNEKDLEVYINQKADGYCEDWKKACNYVNSSKRWEEQLFVDGMINNMMLTGISDIIKQNDLPDNYLEPAIKKFESRMNQCGWNYDRTMWPGESNNSKANSNDNNLNKTTNSNLESNDNYVERDFRTNKEEKKGSAYKEPLIVNNENKISTSNQENTNVKNLDINKRKPIKEFFNVMKKGDLYYRIPGELGNFNSNDDWVVNDWKNKSLPSVPKGIPPSYDGGSKQLCVDLIQHLNKYFPNEDNIPLFVGYYGALTLNEQGEIAGSIYLTEDKNINEKLRISLGSFDKKFTPAFYEGKAVNCAINFRTDIKYFESLKDKVLKSDYPEKNEKTKFFGSRVTRGNRKIIKDFKFESELNKATVYALIKVSPSGQGEFMEFDKGSTIRSMVYANTIKNYLKNIQFNKSEEESIITIQFLFN